jgi:hypothetical protein
MLKASGDGAEAAIGDEFLSFTAGGRSFASGRIDEIDSEHIHVDFGDYRTRYNREHVRKVEENCGFIREYFAATRPGTVVKSYV